jgi:secondary thiamine-phosphate synthase enzyme
MPIITHSITVLFRGENDIIDITKEADQVIRTSRLREGIITILVSGSTAAVTTIEYEPGLKNDFPKIPERLVLRDVEYEHNNTWHDENGRSHIRTSHIGPSLGIPFKNKAPMLET